MTPLEKATLVGSERFDGEVDGLRAYAEFDADDARAIIRAFLEAAAEDERVLSNVLDAIDYELHVSLSKEEIGNANKAAILALKETING